MQGGQPYGLQLSSYPLDIDAATPATIERWRPLLNWLLVIPVTLWATVLTAGSGFVALFSWFAIVSTGRLPNRWSDYQVGVLRYHWRVTAYLYAWTTTYPGFAVPAGHIDPSDQPAILYCARPEFRDRLTVFIRILLVIPHVIALLFVGIAASLVLLVAWFAVLVLGRWPEGLRRFGLGYYRWTMRLQAYYWLVTDEYPPFGFQS